MEAKIKDKNKKREIKLDMPTQFGDPIYVFVTREQILTSQNNTHM